MDENVFSLSFPSPAILVVAGAMAMSSGKWHPGDMPWHSSREHKDARELGTQAQPAFPSTSASLYCHWSSLLLGFSVPWPASHVRPHPAGNSGHGFWCEGILPRSRKHLVCLWQLGLQETMSIPFLFAQGFWSVFPWVGKACFTTTLTKVNCLLTASEGAAVVQGCQNPRIFGCKIPQLFCQV